MALFARRGAVDRGFGGGERLGHFRMVAAKAADHEERRDRDGAQRESRVARDRLLQGADGIAGEPVVIGDGAVERLGRSGRAGERQALLISGHCRLPSACGEVAPRMGSKIARIDRLRKAARARQYRRRRTAPFTQI